MKVIHLLFNDSLVGTHEYGFIPRKEGEEPEDEDRRYERHLRSQDINARVYDAKVKIFDA